MIKSVSLYVPVWRRVWGAGRGAWGSFSAASSCCLLHALMLVRSVEIDGRGSCSEGALVRAETTEDMDAMEGCAGGAAGWPLPAPGAAGGEDDEGDGRGTVEVVMVVVGAVEGAAAGSAPTLRDGFGDVLRPNLSATALIIAV